MKKRFVITLVLLTTILVLAQTAPGTIQVNTSIVATAGASGATGTVVCTIQPLSQPPVVAVQIACQIGTTNVMNATLTPTAGQGGGTVAYTAGTNTVSVMGSIATSGGPLSWQVAANGLSKTGSF